MEKTNLNKTSYSNHLASDSSLVTSHEETRAGFLALALEKNRRANPYIEEAKVLKNYASYAKNAKELLAITDIRSSILTAAGISDKASKHLSEDDKIRIINGLIENFLEPAGEDFIDELVYRFLLTRGDSLGGSMRNLAGTLGERKFSRLLISTLSVLGKEFYWFESASKKWIKGNSNDPEIEYHVKGLSWINNKERTLIYNLKVPIVGNNVDLCLFNAQPNQLIRGDDQKSALITLLLILPWVN